MKGDTVIDLADRLNRSDIPESAEDSIALLFAERYAGYLRFVAKWGKWLQYDGARWGPDSTLHAFDLARTVCREVATDCEKGAGAVASAKTIAAVERIAKTDRRLVATELQWDTDSDAFNAVGETFDLRTGIGRPPDPLDYITKQAACSCAPVGTPHPLWTQFLDRVTDHDTNLQDFLQRYIGYCLTGHTTEEAFVFAYGDGANGKSTFINTLAGIFGDYATVAAMSTFIASNTEQHTTDLAKLCGARLVVAQETQKGRKWDEAKIAALTGGDKQTARFMRQDFFDFMPTFKLFIGGNHKPRLTSVNEANRRRLLLVPFTVLIPPAERDRKLRERLRAEWPAILRWCVDGCLEWRRLGLKPPLSATDEYFATQDTLQQWLDDCTTDGGPLAFSRSKELFASWKAWHEDNNLQPGSTQMLVEALVGRGYEKKRDNAGQRGFRSLVVKPR